jgi:hypothetical protein
VYELVCQECRGFSDERAEGWRGYRIDDPDKTAPPELVFYCPRCAARAFGPFEYVEEDRHPAEGGE